MSTATPIVDAYRLELLRRVEAAAAVVESFRVDAERLTRARDALIVEAVDRGMTQRSVAAAAGVSRARVTSILLAASSVTPALD